MHQGADLLSMAITAASTALLVVATWLLASGFMRLAPGRSYLVRSFAAGVGLAFVALDLFVELLGTSEGPIHELVQVGPRPIHTIAWLLLAGTVIWFVAHSYGARHAESWASYAVAFGPRIAYGALVGVALVEEWSVSARAALLFAVAVTIHLAVTEYSLRSAFPHEHRGVSRAVSLVMPLVGALVWMALEFHVAVYHAILAVVAGATLLGIFRDDMPSPSAVRVGALLAGVSFFGFATELRWWL